MSGGSWLMSNQVIKIGVLGAANIAEKFVIPAIILLPDLFELTAIASRSHSKADEFSKKFGSEAYYSYESLINNKSIKAVYIPLPNALHSYWIRKALLAGKHVLVEKSMACTLEEVIELNSLAQEKKLVLIENFQFRFHKQLDKIKKILADGTIGELRNIKSAFGFPPFPDNNNIRYNKELGGGALLDAGAYPLKIAQEILNEELYVDSASLYTDPDLDVDIWGAAQIKSSQSKLVVQVAFGFDQAYMCNLELWGSKGILRANRIFTSPPNQQAQLSLTTKQGEEIIDIPQDNAFSNLLTYFSELIAEPAKAIKEYRSNINQAKLINQLKDESYE